MAINQCFPKLTTERLKLRPISKQDVENLFLLRSNPIVNKHLERTPPAQLSDVEDFIWKIKEGQKTGLSFYWIIEEKSTGQFLGTICLWNIDNQSNSGEIGYELLPQYHGNGYMSEAVDAVINYVRKNLNVNMIAAYSALANYSSSRLLEKKGFIQKPSDADGHNLHVFSTNK